MYPSVDCLLRDLDNLDALCARFSLRGVDYVWTLVADRLLLNRVKDGAGMGYVKLPGHGSQVFQPYVRRQGEVAAEGLPWDSLYAAQLFVLAYVANDSED